MFGTVVVDNELLTKDERARYSSFYCGLCSRLESEFGSIGCQCLTYDMTFLTILLNSVYSMEENKDERRCVPKPYLHPYVISPATKYAADLNIILAYYQCLDDWNDDGNRIALKKSRLLEKHLPKVKERCPQKWEAISECLVEIGKMEKRNELNPDLPANCFGRLMAELFVWQEDAHAPNLRAMGAALGRYIYLLDAVNDLKSDIKKQRYNPLVAQLDTDFAPVLSLMMAECTQNFEKLPVEKDASILRNILYSGVWLNYRRKRGAAHDGEKSV